MQGPGAATPLYRFYAGLTRLAGPLAQGIVARRMRARGADPARIPERAGRATLPAPNAPVIWFHAASVGEGLSILNLIRRMGERLPKVEFLITSGTPTSAELIGRRLPPRSRHQYAPLDTVSAIDRFLDHWRPIAGIFVESELWPNMLVRSRAKGCRLALLNARLSSKSVEGWQKWPDSARFMLGQFDLMVTQNEQAARNLLAMGADPGRVQRGANLKASSTPPPVDEALLKDMRRRLGRRPVWIAASTHPGEEEVVLAAHRSLLAMHPELMLVLVPRHPERGGDVAALIKDAGLSSARRSTGEFPSKETQVYLADTLGETGSWYALSPIVFLGGSLEEIGGHNPFEPAGHGAAVLTGPHVVNFSESFTPLIAGGGAVEVQNADTLAAAIERWLTHPDALEVARQSARTFASAQEAALDGLVQTLVETLELTDA